VAIWNGIGIRIIFGKALGLVGSTDGVVELELKPGVSVNFIGINCGDIAFFLEKPEAFISALSVG
jgi:hypothetical protein